MTAQTPSTLASVVTLASVTLKRVTRGKALWVGAAIALLPILYGNAVHLTRHTATPGEIFVLLRPLLALLPAMFISASIGEDIEDRTSAYLWSRPIARWAIIAGKLVALVPVITVLIVGSWLSAVAGGTGALPSLASSAALIAACIATSLVAAAIAVLVPKHGMALTIGYLLLDNFFGALPLSLAQLSLTHQAHELAQLGDPAVITPAIALAAIAAAWTAIGLARIRRLEV